MKFAVMGSGNGGHAMAADLSSRGFEVNLFEMPEFSQSILAIDERGGIQMSGVTGSRFARLNLVTTKIDKALEDVDVVMIVVPAYAHRTFAEICAPYAEGRTIILNPGSTGGTIEFTNVLNKKGVENVTVAETQSLVYACRKTGPAQVNISGVKKALPLAALPAKQTSRVVKLLNEAYPQIIPAVNVLQTSLDNLNAWSHPLIMLLNAGRIESTEGNFLFHREGVTPSVGRVLEAIDREIQSIKRAFDLEPVPIIDWLDKWYGMSTKGRSAYDVISHSSVHGRKAPDSMQFRYVTEDVPYGLVPMASLGDVVGVETSTIKAVIHLTSLVNNADYWNEGRTVEKLGIAGFNTRQIKALVTEGWSSVCT